ncbi:hypothetical protein KIN20_026646 [Parelaphostrongylus tenuis]|uniref:Mos1 transposase HTH domain-containing protein n=1 Tax=Parelaphostrongylus tenuis TaxID=148309 RepID=A0AAD5WCY3_PARTN|nr:hypothetical protein KIN20_026646 [Parelaphostrongylus tenuis]
MRKVPPLPLRLYPLAWEAPSVSLLFAARHPSIGKKAAVNKRQIRLFMMHEGLLGSDATMASERINLAWGEDTVDKKYRCITWYSAMKKSPVSPVVPLIVE